MATNKPVVDNAYKGVVRNGEILINASTQDSLYVRPATISMAYPDQERLR
jgi:hypothetical protein